MFEVRGLHDGLPVLLVVFCVLLAHRFNLSYFRNLWSKGKSQVPLPCAETTTDIDGNRLYYGGMKWPQYEATFNLRLSYLYGPVITIKHGPETRLARAVRWVNTALFRDWRPSDTTVLINSLSENETVLKRLLGSCASRSPSIAAGKYLSGGRRIVLQPYGPDWSRYRRAFTSPLTKEKINSRWTRALRFEAMVMADRIANLGSISSPSDLNVLDEISRFTASSVLQITYARRAPTPHDQVLKDLETVSKNIADAFTPGKYWVDEFPLLDIFPTIISPWKQKLNADHEFELGIFTDLLHGAESNLGGNKSDSEESVIGPSGASVDSVIGPGECAAAELLRNKEHLQLDRDDIAYLSAGIFEAGTETTAMTINTFLLAAASYPVVARRAQAEIDGLMHGQHGSAEPVPTFEDLQRLPYLAAIVKETLRLTPTGSSGVGHTPTRAEPQTLELSYNVGRQTMRLKMPSGTTVLANTYGLHHNPRQFPDPWRFDPDRWLPTDSDTQSLSKVHNPEALTVPLDHTNANYAFGFGRRICPGSSLASYSLSMSIAVLLLCFDFELTDDARLHYIEIEEQQREEHKKWNDLFPSLDRDIIQNELSLQKGYRDERDQIGRVLIDSHIAFKLSRKQLAECIHLRPRTEDYGLKGVREALAMMQYA
ncbi:Steroid 17-alpha-hydroxylase/17,20 lyase [Cytospora mali]|uniref:Steroid 17-alpha-hydroxylase/17,20 lyase n=1 Tax=Cytospora mali TaxID=578113 RepID=A0A194UV25_CYTMA|nr:Steroid 17-alpha-hydroxylase/17,20 lyase [Valsa mali var. pyri (nom. inval.)]